MKKEFERHYLPYLVESDCEAGKLCKPYFAISSDGSHQILDLWFESPDGSFYNFDPELGDQLLDLDRNVIPIEVLPGYLASEPDKFYFSLCVTEKSGRRYCLTFNTYVGFLEYRKVHDHLWRCFELTKVFLMPDSM